MPTFTFPLPLMAPPKKYHTLESKRRSVCEKSKCYYERNRRQIRLQRRAAYDAKTSAESCSNEEPTVVNVKHITRLRKTNALEIQTRRKYLTRQVNSPPSSKKPAPAQPLPPVDLFLKLDAEANALQDKFNSFIQGVSISEYAESLLKAYFKSSSKRQGQIGVFVDPLQELYGLRDSYTKIEARSREVEGLSTRHNVLVQTGIPIHKVVEWVEDFWRCAIDGPGSLRLRKSSESILDHSSTSLESRRSNSINIRAASEADSVKSSSKNMFKRQYCICVFPGLTSIMICLSSTLADHMAMPGKRASKVTAGARSRLAERQEITWGKASGPLKQNLYSVQALLQKEGNPDHWDLDSGSFDSAVWTVYCLVKNLTVSVSYMGDLEQTVGSPSFGLLIREMLMQFATGIRCRQRSKLSYVAEIRKGLTGFYTRISSELSRLWCLWEPFYAEGRKKKRAGQAELQLDWHTAVKLQPELSGTRLK
ncbi:uncharacterized protein EV420DRAFT_1487665 [Desarmillaria tabescens]|uniref:Uncharacterized protein n=1 Tax=Armillaria tabescens TaxID=1929756 RepID=A0AA39J4M7_ARMTA|nr:uncharacterized protein EV420DRAFT_1487665 [Desarmillaria tabescens]KAK0436072.1 hypothetical protein EV420DRAFT_1487665 [Desarmillaria tabescens]